MMATEINLISFNDRLLFFFPCDNSKINYLSPSMSQRDQFTLWCDTPAIQIQTFV